MNEGLTRWEWYERLAKPRWTPPGSTIGMIWSLLYPVILVTFGYVTVRVGSGDMPVSALVPLGINVISNVAFTPIQFGLRSLVLASADIMVVLASIVWCMATFWPHAPVASIALVPYLAWVGTATVLQLSITRMNSRRPGRIVSTDSFD